MLYGMTMQSIPTGLHLNQEKESHILKHAFTNGQLRVSFAVEGVGTIFPGIWYQTVKSATLT